MYPKLPYSNVSVVVCPLNEENLPHVLPKISVWVNEVILVDDHLTDKTVKVAKRLRPDVRVLYQPNRDRGDTSK